MTLTVLALVLAAANTHAAWNTWLKVSGDRLVVLATISIGWTAIALVSLIWVGLPAPAAGIILSCVFSANETREHAP